MSNWARKALIVPLERNTAIFETEHNPDDIYSFVIREVPADPESVKLLKEHFANDDIAHTRSFTGHDAIIILAKRTGEGIAKMLAWFKLHGATFEHATIEVGKEKVVIKGYAAEDVNELLRSGVVNKLLRDLKLK